MRWHWKEKRVDGLRIFRHMKYFNFTRIKHYKRSWYFYSDRAPVSCLSTSKHRCGGVFLGNKAFSEAFENEDGCARQAPMCKPPEDMLSSIAGGSLNPHVLGFIPDGIIYKNNACVAYSKTDKRRPVSKDL